MADTLESLAADFAAAAGLVEPASLVVVERAAAAIRDDWRAAWTFGAGTTVPYLAAAVTSEAGLLPGVGAWAEIGPDNSLLGGLIGALVLIGANDVVVRMVRRNDAIDRAMEGSETRLVQDGAFRGHELRRLGIRVADLEVALRRQGAEHVLQVQQADLYPSGALVVDLRPGARGASLEDIGRLERKLDDLALSVGRLAAGKGS